LDKELEQINKLLTRQIRKNYSGEITPELIRLLNAINQSYQHYENDRILLERAMEISNVELEEANEKLRTQSQILKDKNQTLEEFIFALAHDLRTPIRSIVSFNNIILKRYSSTLNENVKEYLNYSVNSATHMNELLTDLLEYASVSHKDALDKRKVDMKSLVDMAKYSLKSEIDSKQVKVNILSSIDLYANSNQLTRVFTNLISNSIKYQKEDVIPVIHIEGKEGPSKIILSISDNGVGVQEEYQNKIFEAFSRLNPNESKGTGIGLAICKKIIEQHKGELWLDTNYEGGAKFMFTLPKQLV
jgi:signal transduction histidine kinase